MSYTILKDERDKATLEDLASRLSQVILGMVDIHTKQVPLSFPDRRNALLQKIIQNLDKDLTGGAL